MSSPQPIKVLECIRQGSIGGGESHLLSLVENLDRSRFDPVVLSFTDGPMITRLKELGVPVHIIHTTKPFNIFKWKTVRRFIEQQGVQLVHAHGTRANSNVLWPAKKLKIPVIYTVHGWSFHDDQHPLIKKIRIWGEKLLTANTSRNISVSESNKQTGVKNFSSFSSVVVNNGIDRKKFNPGGSFTAVRKEWNIPDDAVIILFIARFTHQKQPLALLNAFIAAAKENSRIHLVMIGDGEQKEAASAIVQQAEVKDRIHLFPFRQDVPHVLAAADIFVLPSLWEGLPIGLLEAMAMGKAIIATRVDGTSEIIKHNENGFLIEPAALEKNLGAALLELAADPVRRTQLGEQAAQTVRERFDAEKMTRQIESIYLDVTGKKNNHETGV